MKIIKKLLNTQAIQKQAYTELEEAINNKPVITSSNVHMQSRFIEFVGGLQYGQSLGLEWQRSGINNMNSAIINRIGTKVRLQIMMTNNIITDIHIFYFLLQNLKY